MGEPVSAPDGPPRVRSVDPHAYLGPEYPEPHTWRQRLSALLPGVLGILAGIIVVVFWPALDWFASVAIASGCGVVLLGSVAAVRWRRRRKASQP